ncbi:MAG: ABC transporter permease [Rickettsia sp.]|nr:ABC transporter permease [Rickettsia sp.]
MKLNNVKQINWYGMYYLSLREIKRFLKVYHQTILGPMISAVLFLLIFSLAMKKNIDSPQNLNFIGYGIIIMSIIQNSFANSSSSLIMFKVLGYIIDILTPPLGSIEIILAFIIGSVVRALLVGLSVAIALAFFVNYKIHNLTFLLLFSILGSILLSQFGILSALIAKSFEQNTAFTNYFIMPLSFLSGTFYSIKNLSPMFQKFNLVNPFFYIIDGFRFGLTNYNDSNLAFGIMYLTILNLILFVILNFLWQIGWNVKN